jgi:hypothetical protein
VRSFYYIVYRNSVCTSQEIHFVSATDPTRSLRTNNHTVPSHLRLCSLFVASYYSQGLRWRYSNPPPHGYLIFWTSHRQYLGVGLHGVVFSIYYCCVILDNGHAHTINSPKIRGGSEGVSGGRSNMTILKSGRHRQGEIVLSSRNEANRREIHRPAFSNNERTHLRCYLIEISISWVSFRGSVCELVLSVCGVGSVTEHELLRSSADCCHKYSYYCPCFHHWVTLCTAWPWNVILVVTCFPRQQEWINVQGASSSNPLESPYKEVIIPRCNIGRPWGISRHWSRLVLLHYRLLFLIPFLFAICNNTLSK